MAMPSLKESFYGEFIGLYAAPQKQPAPIVLIAHPWRGRIAYMGTLCQQLAKHGYVGFAMDLFGQGECVSTNDEALARISPFLEKPHLMKTRIDLAYEHVKTMDEVDPSHIFLIGYCFGGSCVIEYLRQGGVATGAAAFHAVFNPAKIKRVGQLNAPKHIETLLAPLMLLHGDRDPLAPLEDLITLVRSLKGDVQTHIFSDTCHAFTNPDANTPDQGLQYHPKSDVRSWELMLNFFATLRSSK